MTTSRQDPGHLPPVAGAAAPVPGHPVGHVHLSGRTQPTEVDLQICPWCRAQAVELNGL